MKNVVLLALAAVSLATFPLAARADQANFSFGGDTYAAGQTVSVNEPVARDAFLAGYDVTLGTPVSGDAHLAGFDVQSSSAVAGNLYAAGFNLHLSGSVGGDVTAMGNTISLELAGPLSGNARLAGATLTVGSEVAGSLLGTARALTLNAPVRGDFSFYGETLTFGPNARVDGKVQIHAPKPIEVPASVAAADKVTFTQVTLPDYPNEVSRTAGDFVRSFWLTVWAVALWWLLLFVVGAAMISLSPKLVDTLSVVSATRPFRRIGLGLLTFAATIGLVPLAFLTLIGIVLLPFVALFVAVACSLAYLAGVYFSFLNVAARVTSVESNGRKMVVLALALVVGGLLTMIPFLGWFITLAFLAFGFGVVASVVMVRWSGGDSARLGAGSSPAAPKAA